MKFFITLAAVVAVAVAVPAHRQLVLPGPAGPAPVIDEAGAPIAIGPAIIDFSPVAVGPAIIETSPVSIGPEIIDFPLPEATPVAPAPVVQPSPVVVGEVPAGSSPLVQIIVNVNEQASAPGVVAPAPVDTPVIEEVYVPGPVNVVDHVVYPEQVIAPEVIEPIIVLDPVVPGPVNIVDNVEAPVVPAPVVIGTPVLPEVVIPEPVIVGTPIIPAPVAVLPEELN